MPCDANIHGPYSQTLFLGGTISSFSSQIGWNSSESSLDVTVVHDACETDKIYYDCQTNPKTWSSSDSFSPPILGSPVYFKFADFEYAGILRNWKEKTNQTQTYVVQCSGPNIILDAVKVIIGGYSGETLGVPNVLNAYGYLEEVYGGSCPLDASLYTLLGYNPALGFGGADRTLAGLSWNQLRLALGNLINGISLPADPDKFGTSPIFRGHSYNIDLSNLPVTVEDLRFDGDTISLLDIINRVCDYAGMDWYATLSLSGGTCDTSDVHGWIPVNGTKTIVINTAVRTTQPASANSIDVGTGLEAGARLDLGTITSFISANGRESSDRGIELRPEVTNALVVGDFRQDLWQINYAATGVGFQNAYTGSIWPYWGKDANGYPIISSGLNDNHNFNINISDIWDTLLDTVISGQITNTYNVHLPELWAVVDKGGESTWMDYLDEYKPLISSGLGIAPDGEIYKIQGINGAVGAIKADHVKSTSRFSAERAMSTTLDENADFGMRLFNKLTGYAQTYMGKKFLVTTPIVCSAPSQDMPYSIDRSWDVSDGAWTEGNVLDLHTGSGVASDGLELFRLEDGRIKCILKFDNNQSRIDMTNWDSSNYYQGASGIVYTTATVEEMVFLDPINGLYPRAVVSVEQPVRANKVKIDDEEFGGPTNMGGVGFMMQHKMNRLANVNTSVKNLNGQPGADTIRWGIIDEPLWPTKAAVPYKSTTLRYGPWVGGSFADAVMTDAVIETDLNPWTYGNTANMSAVGQMIATNRTLAQNISELGTVTVAGAPAKSLGGVLVAGGPEITNIDVSVGQNGVTTSYQLRTFTPNYDSFSKTKIDNLRKNAESARYIQRLDKIARLNNRRTPNSQNALGTILNREDRYTRSSSSAFMLGHSYQDYEPDVGFTNASVTGVENLVLTDRVVNAVVNTDLRKALPEFGSGDAWLYRAGMETQGMFRPYTTKYGGICHMSEYPTDISVFSQEPPTSGVGTAASGYIEEVSKFNYANNDTYSFRGPVFNEALPPIMSASLNPFLQPKQYTESVYLSGVFQHYITHSGDENSQMNITITDPDLSEPSGQMYFTMGSGYGHDIEYVIRDGVYPLDLSIKYPENNYSSEGWYRGIGLKGPPIITGWGNDIYGKPVPNYDSGHSHKFADDWLNKPHLWKTGPLDIRWDDRRGVWTSPTHNRIVKVSFPGSPVTSGDYSVLNAEITDDNVTAYDEDGNEISKLIEVNSYLGVNLPSGTAGLAFYNSDMEDVGNYQKYDLLSTNESTNIIRGILGNDLSPGGTGLMTVWRGAPLADASTSISVYDDMEFITTGYHVPSGRAITASLHSGRYQLLTIKGCEVEDA